MLVTATMCLLAYGAVMVYSASSGTSVLKGDDTGSGLLLRYLIYGGLGLVLLRVVSRRGLGAWREVTPALLIVSFVLLLAVLVPGVGVAVNGARRWLGAGPIQFQPSELMKLALVLYGARVLAGRPQSVRSLRGLAPLLLTVGGACLLVAVQPDLGTAIVLALTAASMLLVAGIPLGKLGIVGGVASSFVAVYAVLAPYRRARLTSFLDPWAHASGNGFQAVQGQIALGSGGVFGRGLGRSVQKLFFLPEAHTDFILAVIGEELGVLGVVGLLVLYAMVALAGLRAARGARDDYTKLLAAGLTAMILSQALLNMFTVLGMAPLTGVPLPFISYGSSSLLIMLVALGMLVNIAAGGSVPARALRSPARHDRRARADPRATPRRRRPAA